MSAKKCNNCGEIVLPYYDKTTDTKKCPKCEAYIEASPIFRGVIIKDIEMSFWSMVVFTVKWTIASIPAIIMTAVIIIYLCELINRFG